MISGSGLPPPVPAHNLSVHYDQDPLIPAHFSLVKALQRSPRVLSHDMLLCKYSKTTCIIESNMT